MGQQSIYWCHNGTNIRWLGAKLKDLCISQARYLKVVSDGPNWGYSTFTLVWQHFCVTPSTFEIPDMRDTHGGEAETCAY